MISLLSSSYFSFPKNDERENQDSILPATQIGNSYVFAVADGVGSYEGAKQVSSIAVEHIAHLTELELNITDIFTVIREKIIAFSDSEPRFAKAATTLTMAILNSNGLRIGHIGDCRLYVKEGNKLRQKTTDHTSHQKLLEHKIYTKKELKTMSGKNIINEALTKRLEANFDEIFIPYEDIPTENNLATFYIMSDGAHAFWEHRPRFSANTLNHTDSFSASLRRRIEKAPTDDYSLVAVQFKL